MTPGWKTCIVPQFTSFLLLMDQGNICPQNEYLSKSCGVGILFCFCGFVGFFKIPLKTQRHNLCVRLMFIQWPFDQRPCCSAVL